MEQPLDSIVISSEEVGQRLDKILACRFSSIKSRSYFESLFEAGKIAVNGKAAKKRYTPTCGDEVEIEWIYTPELQLKPEAIPLNIIYEDEFLIVVNKPAGLVVHPAAGNWNGTFVNALLHHCQGLQQHCPSSAKAHVDVRPGIVHRLDKDTTGLLLAAKTERAQLLLSAAFAERKVDKEYLAICVGHPGDRTIDLPIARHPVHRKEMSVCHERGRQATTVCRSLAQRAPLSLVSLLLLTGRTHQLRVHLKAVGCPILGDPIYGSTAMNKKYGVSRQMLHAHRLSFCHPFTGEHLTFTAPMPEEMSQLKIFL
jgi:23S rRNA pseudouridine1911/1915/1917 synthase